ncbi:MAG: GNAT family N-acetyltransferase [Saprospiraceae bacterium]
MKKYKSFETERLFLRPSAITDAPFVLELLNTPKWIKNIGDRNVKTLEDAELYIKEKMLPQLDRLGFGNYFITRKTDNVTIGSCGLYDRDGLEGVDIGFAFLPEHEGQGYAYESAVKIKEIGINEFGVKKISAITIEENVASRKLIEKLGLTFQKMINLPDDDVELMLYTLEV